MTTIPASLIVNVTPSVLAAGGTAIDLNGLFLTATQRVPIGAIQSFASPAAVNAYFGASSHEAAMAAVYFQADDNSLAKPGSLLFAQYPVNAVAPFERGASLGTMTLTTLQGLTGSLSVAINGVTFSGTPILSGATSFAGAAVIIASALGLTGKVDGSVTGQQGATFNGTASGTTLSIGTITGGGVINVGDTLSGSGVPANTTITAQLTGTPNGTGTYTTNNSTTIGGTATIIVQSTILHVTAVSSGSVTLGDVASGTGITAGTFVLSQVSGTTGGVGFYTVGTSQFYPSQPISIQVPGVAYDSVTGAFQINGSLTGGSATIAYASGALATSLNLTQSTGAVLSQGANAATPAAFMAAQTLINQNWATFQFGFNLDSAGGNANRLAAAQWASTTNNRYVFICWDTDASPTTQSTASSSLGQLIAANGYSGTILVWEPSDLLHAPFVAGWAAALDFEAVNGRRTLAFRNQSGLTPAVTDQATATNLLSNNYNFLGVFGTGNENFTYFYDGGISGPFLWADSFMDQIWMNNAFQVDLVTLLGEVGTIPYNADGNALIEAGLADTIQQAGNFGVFRPGVQLSQSQITQVNNSAGGKNIATTLETRGWYLVILPTPPSVRQVRGSPPCTFWYVDGQSVQQIQLSSIELQ